MALCWREAMHAALYGPDGFYRRPDGPRAHFRTAVTDGGALVRAVHRLADEVDAALGRPPAFTVLDMGAGHGELLTGLVPHGVPDRWRLLAVEVADRPTGLDERIGWTHELPVGVTGLVVAHEYLDVVPLDVVVATDEGPRQVLVDPGGTEHVGQPPRQCDLDWLSDWWPLPVPGAQAEVGSSRDAAWRALVGSLTAGAALAVDYDHVAGARPSVGTLTGYRHGRQVRPVPDGSCDLTAHVALDACAAAASDLVTATWTGRQHEALAAVEASGGTHSVVGGFGSFGWLLQSVGTALPPSLRRRPG